MHHLAAVELRILDLAVELAIREQSCAAFAELHIGFRCLRVLPPQRPGVLGAAAHVAAAFQHDGPEAHLRQQQRGEQAAGAESHDDGPFLPLFRRFRDGMIGGIRRNADLPVAGQAPQHGGFVAHRDIDDADEQDAAVLLAGVVAALDRVRSSSSASAMARRARTARRSASGV